MNKEKLIELGLTQELAEKVVAELDGAYVPKERFNQVNERMKAAERLAKETKDQLDALKAAGDPAELKTQLEAAQQAAEQQAQEHKAAMSDLELTYAIRAGLSDAQDADIVAGLLDRKKLKLEEGGKLSGLDEQLKSLKEAKPFLFRQEEQQKPPFTGWKPGENGDGGKPGRMTLEAFRKLSPAERFRFSRNHPDEYKQLYDGGTN